MVASLMEVSGSPTRVGPVVCRGLVMPGANRLIVCPPPKLSSTQECDKDRPLKYVKATVEKKISKN